MLYKRVLLKVSGEVLMGERDYGIDVNFVESLASSIIAAGEIGTEIAIVIGGGNIFRGVAGASRGMDRARGDFIGMMATVMNSLALQDALEKQQQAVRVMSALNVPEVAENYIVNRGIRHLEKGRIVICAAGTGNPYFTTDSAATLRALELKCDVMLKATKVDGIYDKDPKKYSDAIKYNTVSYSDALQKNLKVMDASALSIARDNDLPIRVFPLSPVSNISKVLNDPNLGTLVSK